MMKANHFLTSIVVLVLTGTALAQTPTQYPAPAQPLNKKDKPFEYKPLDAAFWFEVEEGIKDPNNLYVIKVADQKLKKTGTDSLEGAEAQLALGKALVRHGLSFAGTKLFSDIIKTKQGTQASWLSLIEIQEIAKKNPVDEDAVYGELVYDIDYDSPPKEVADFVGYLNGMYNKLNGYTAWSEKEFKKVTSGSYWDYKLKYLAALEDVKREKIDSAVEKFLALANDELTPKDIKTDSQHQYARLVFEKGDYLKAYKTFKQVELDPRERGLILLERAWSKYYLKDYSKALGLLTALEAPAFDPSRSPEAYLLKMLIYKELCYYDAAFEVMKEFKQRFSASMDAIRKRKDLRKDKMLVNMAVIDRRVSYWVNYLNLLKEERTRLKEFQNLAINNQLKREYDLKISEVYSRLNLILADRIRFVANDLLESHEQISFLDYQTRVDSLRVSRPQDEVDFKPEKISLTKFDKIYWLFKGEYWIDEIEDLKVLVESQCNKANVK